MADTHTKIAKMTDELTSQYRWAITGTPIQTSVYDLFGLLSFIRKDPYDRKIIWDFGVFYPYCNGEIDRLVDVLKKCFWRTPRERAFQMLGLGQPISSIKFLTFSQIEQTYYQQNVSTAKQKIEKYLSKFSEETKLKCLHHSVQDELLKMTVNLRVMCCFPMKVGFSTNHNYYSSLSDLLSKIIEDNKYDCEQFHRTKIASLNAVAGAFLDDVSFEFVSS